MYFYKKKLIFIRRYFLRHFLTKTIISLKIINSSFFELEMNELFTRDYRNTRSYSNRTRTELNRTRDKIVGMKKSYA